MQRSARDAFAFLCSFHASCAGFDASNVSFLHSDRIVLEDEFTDAWLCVENVDAASVQSEHSGNSPSIQPRGSTCTRARSWPLLWLNIPVLREDTFIHKYNNSFNTGAVNNC